MLNVECWVLNGCALRNVECWVLNVEWSPLAMLNGWLLNGRAVRNVECWVLNVEWSPLAMLNDWLLNYFTLHSSFFIGSAYHSTFHIRHCALRNHSTFHIPHSSFFSCPGKKFFLSRELIFLFCFTIAKLRNVCHSCNSCGGVAGRLWRSSIYECWMYKLSHLVI